MGFEPKKQQKKKFVINCPLKFTIPECGTECIGYECAWWLPIQKACSVQVLARGNAFPKGEY